MDSTRQHDNQVSNQYAWNMDITWVHAHPCMYVRSLPVPVSNDLLLLLLLLYILLQHPAARYKFLCLTLLQILCRSAWTKRSSRSRNFYNDSFRNVIAHILPCSIHATFGKLLSVMCYRLKWFLKNRMAWSRFLFNSLVENSSRNKPPQTQEITEEPHEIRFLCTDRVDIYVDKLK